MGLGGVDCDSSYSAMGDVFVTFSDEIGEQFRIVFAEHEIGFFVKDQYGDWNKSFFASGPTAPEVLSDFVAIHCYF
jgi:hypothetical protein